MWREIISRMFKDKTPEKLKLMKTFCLKKMIVDKITNIKENTAGEDDWRINVT